MRAHDTVTVTVILSLVLVFLPLHAVAQSPPVGLWNFDTPADLTNADVGNDLVLVGSHAYVEGTEPGDGAARIGSGSHYICDHNIPANGGGASVNEYTVVMDIKTFGRGLWHCFLQTNPSNSDDGEVFVSPPGRVGVTATGYSYPRMLDAKTWYRVAIVVDNGVRYEIYVDGIRILDGTTQSVDGRFSLDPTVLLFADNDAEDRQLDVSRVALYDEALSAGEIETLGGLGGMTHFVTRPFLQNVKRDGISIMWETEELETAYVECGTTPSYGSTESASSVDSGHGTRIYTAVLTGLSPESTYHYRVVSGPSATEDATFSTAPDGHVSFSFGVWSDSQGYDWIDGSDPTEPTRAMLDHMVGEGIDIAVSCGDLAEDGGSYEDTRVFYVDRPVAHVGGQGVPFFNAWGNHDAGSSAIIRLFADMPSKDRGAPFHAGYGSFSFDYGGCHFICVDYLCESSDIPGWVEQDLQSVEAQNARFTFLFVHRPPYCERWYSGQSNLRDDLVPLMEEYGVDVCFSGHTHAYGRGYLNGVYYCITGGGSWLDLGEPLVYDWPHMTVGGYHDVAPDIDGGLINEYMKVEVEGATMTARMMAFHPDGTFREVLDTFSKDTDLPGDWPVAAFSGTPTSGDAPLTVTFADESTNDPTSWSWDFGDGTTSGDQNPIHTYASDGSYTVSLTAANDAGSDTETKTAYITVGDGLFCYWALDEGSGDVAYDSAGGHDGTLYGPTWVSGQIGHGLSFDGLDDYVEIGATDLGGSWTAAMWVNRSADRSASALMGSSAGALKLEQWPDTHQVGITDYAAGDYSFAYSTPIGEWVHLAFVCDGTKTLLYVNGAPSDSVTAAIAMPLGRMGDGVAYADPPAASLDEVRVYSRALDVTEIHALWEGATGVTEFVDGSQATGRPALRQNHPNPFSSSTTIRFDLAARTLSRLVVYNVRGQVVRRLVAESLPEGSHRVLWDGRNDAGEDLTAGVYFVKLEAGEVSTTKKVVITR